MFQNLSLGERSKYSTELHSACNINCLESDGGVKWSDGEFCCLETATLGPGEVPQGGGVVERQVVSIRNSGSKCPGSRAQSHTPSLTG